MSMTINSKGNLALLLSTCKMIDNLHKFHKNSVQEMEVLSILVLEKWYILLSCVVDTWS